MQLSCHQDSLNYDRLLSWHLKCDLMISNGRCGWTHESLWRSFSWWLYPWKIGSYHTDTQGHCGFKKTLFHISWQYWHLFSSLQCIRWWLFSMCIFHPCRCTQLFTLKSVGSFFCFERWAIIIGEVGGPGTPVLTSPICQQGGDIPVTRPSTGSFL